MVRREKGNLDATIATVVNLPYLVLTGKRDSLMKVYKKEPVKNILKTKMEQPHEIGCFEKIFLNQVFLIQINLIYYVLSDSRQPLSCSSYCNTLLTDLPASILALLNDPFKR